jgi:Transglutaminase-like superfamily
LTNTLVPTDYAEQGYFVGAFSTNVTELAKRICAESETYLNLRPKGTDETDFKHAIKAIIALKYINTIVSAPLRPHVPPDIANQYDGQKILDSGVGICGQQIEAMIALCDALELPCRMVQMSWDYNGLAVSHVTSEVKLQTGWAYLDASFGAMVCRGENIYDLVSLGDIMDGLSQYEVLHSAWDPWRYEWVKNFGDPVLGLPEAPDWDVTFDGTGCVFVPFKDNVAQFDARLNFIGYHARNNGRMGNHSLAFDVPDGYDLEIEFGGASFFKGRSGTLIVRDLNRILLECVVTQDLGKIIFKDIDSCLHMSILNLDVCTVVINGARLIPVTTSIAA